MITDSAPSHTVAVITSSRVPPSVLLAAYDVSVLLRSNATNTIGGFHTSLERECLEILLRGQQPITICPAREFGEGHRLYSGKLWESVKRGVAEGRVTIQSPPGVRGTRITRQNAEIRNAYLLEIADRMLVLAASEGSRTAALATEAIGRGMPVFVMDHPVNAHLLDAGARVFSLDALTSER